MTFSWRQRTSSQSNLNRHTEKAGNNLQRGERKCSCVSCFSESQCWAPNAVGVLQIGSSLVTAWSLCPCQGTAQQLRQQSLKTHFSLCSFEKLQTPTAQTQYLTSCQDLVLFRIRNTEPQKTVKNNRGWLSPVTGGYTDGNRVRNCPVSGGVAAPMENSSRCCSVACRVFSTKPFKEAVKPLQCIKPFKNKPFFFFINRPWFWCQEKIFAFKQSHFTVSCWCDSSPEQTF